MDCVAGMKKSIVSFQSFLSERVDWICDKYEKDAAAAPYTFVFGGTCPDAFESEVPCPSAPKDENARTTRDAPIGESATSERAVAANEADFSYPFLFLGTFPKELEGHFILPGASPKDTHGTSAKKDENAKSIKDVSKDKGATSEISVHAHEADFSYPFLFLGTFPKELEGHVMPAAGPRHLSGTSATNNESARIIKDVSNDKGATVEKAANANEPDFSYPFLFLGTLPKELEGHVIPGAGSFDRQISDISTRTGGTTPPQLDL